MAKPLKVAVTGAAGNVGYALAFRLAAGDAFGADREIELSLIEIQPAMQALEGVAMELEDCAFPLLSGIDLNSSPAAGFRDVEWAVLVGAKPRVKGSERSDLIRDNAPLFVEQGRALSANADPGVRVTVVGNPANLNCAVACNAAPGIPDSQFSALTRLDHNRAVSLLARKSGVGTARVRRIAIWGNHSSTQYPCLSHAEIDGRRDWPALQDRDWIRDSLIPQVQDRGASVIAQRGQSSAASAANAVVDHLRDWHGGTPAGDFVSMGIKGRGAYDAPPQVFFSYPVTVADGEVSIVPDLPLDEFDRKMIDASGAELVAELEAVADVLD